MRHTLRDYMKHYNVKYVTLIFADHVIDIDFDKNGSLAIVRAFGGFNFEFISFGDGLLVLKY